MAHKTAAGNTSGAWHDLEKRVAELFRKAGFRQSKRIILTEHEKRSVSRPDVDVPEVREMAVDTKYRNGGWNHHSVFENEVAPYVGINRKGEQVKYTWAIMPTRAGGSKDIFVTLRIEHFLDILARAFLRNTDGGWSCPRCPDRLEKQGQVMGLYQFTCKSCGLVLLSQEEAGEPVPEPVKKPTEPKVVIKDHTAATFTPLPGQLTLKDLEAKKKALGDGPKRTRKRVTR